MTGIQLRKFEIVLLKSMPHYVSYTVYILTYDWTCKIYIHKEQLRRLAKVFQFCLSAAFCLQQVQLACSVVHVEYKKTFIFNKLDY